MLSRSKNLSRHSKASCPSIIPECEPKFACTKEAERRLAQRVMDGKEFHEYTAIAGAIPYRNTVTELVLGEDAKSVKEGRAGTLASFGGSGALRIALDFAADHLKLDVLYLPRKVAENFDGVIVQTHFKERIVYDRAEDLKLLQPESVLIVDLSSQSDEWKELEHVLKSGRAFPVVTGMGLGLNSGGFDAACRPLRDLEASGIEFLVCLSFGRSFGLRESRPGAVIAVAMNKSEFESAFNCLEFKVSRGGPSVAPYHGAAVMLEILRDRQLREQWLQELIAQIS